MFSTSYFVSLVWSDAINLKFKPLKKYLKAIALSLLPIMTLKFTDIYKIFFLPHVQKLQKEIKLLWNSDSHEKQWYQRLVNKLENLVSSRTQNLETLNEYSTWS